MTNATLLDNNNCAGAATPTDCMVAASSSAKSTPSTGATTAATTPTDGAATPPAQQRVPYYPTIIADRFKTRPCRNFIMSGGMCQYSHRCMFAHGDHELRTAAQNIADGLVTEAAVREYVAALPPPSSECRSAPRSNHRPSSDDTRRGPKALRPSVQPPPYHAATRARTTTFSTNATSGVTAPAPVMMSCPPMMYDTTSNCAPQQLPIVFVGQPSDVSAMPVVVHPSPPIMMMPQQQQQVVYFTQAPQVVQLVAAAP